MTTARDLITDAAAEIGEAAQDSALSDYDAQLALRRFQRMLDSWANESLMVYASTQESFSTVAGTVSYSTSALALGRPVKILSAFLRTTDSTDWPLELVRSKEEYDRICQKASQAMPDSLFYLPAMSNGTMYLYPNPDTVYTIYVTSQRLLATTLTLGSTITLPPGYEEAIVTNLAIAIAPMFGASAGAETIQNARRTKRFLKTTNYVPLEMNVSLASPRSGTYPGILVDE